ncbi:MAG: hypothetical protein ACRDR6_29175 [Pseudonocardiaceae bacterium]
MPRHNDLPVELRGPRVLGYLGRVEADRVPEHDMDSLATTLQAHPVLSGPSVTPPIPHTP